MAPLNFCEACGEKRIKEVRTELQKLFAKRQHDSNHCGFCNTQLKMGDEGKEITSDDWSVEGDVSNTELDTQEEVDPEDVKSVEVKKHYFDPDTITNGLDVHVLKMMDPVEDPAKPYKCKLCKMDCAKIYNFLRHLKIKHQLDYIQEKPYKCEYCHEGFTCFTHLQDHLTTHRADGNKVFTCELCGSCLKTIYSYRRHIQIQHKSKRNKPCRYCGKLFRHATEVTGHEKIHINMKPHVCDQCPKAFRTAGRLKRHQQIHSDLKPYVCGYCNHRVRDKDYLKKHIKVCHTGTTPQSRNYAYACSHCEFTSTDSKDMVSHRMTHIASHRMTHIASKVSNILHQAQSDVVLESVQTEPSTSTVVFQLAEAAPKTQEMRAAQQEEKVHQEEVVEHEVQVIEHQEEVVEHQEVVDQQGEVVITTQPGVNSSLPPETIQAISKLLEEADNSSLTTSTTEAVAEDVVYQCMECGFQSAAVVVMRTHMSQHLPDSVESATEIDETGEVVTYRCEDCGCTSSNAADLYTHVLTAHVHEEQEEIEEGTSEENISKAQQEEVIEVKDGISENANIDKCEKCNVTFSDPTDLRIHRASHISVKTSTNPAERGSPSKSKFRIQTIFAQASEKSQSNRVEEERVLPQSNTQSISRREKGQVLKSQVSTIKAQKTLGEVREDEQVSLPTQAQKPEVVVTPQVQNRAKPLTRSQVQEGLELPATSEFQKHHSRQQTTSQAASQSGLTGIKLTVQKPSGTSPHSTRDPPAAKRQKLSDSLIGLDGGGVSLPRMQTRLSSKHAGTAKADPKSTNNRTPKKTSGVVAKTMQTSSPSELVKSTDQSDTSLTDQNQAAKVVQASLPKVPKQTSSSKPSQATRMQHEMLVGSGVRIKNTLSSQSQSAGRSMSSRSKSAEVDFNRMTFM